MVSSMVRDMLVIFDRIHCVVNLLAFGYKVYSLFIKIGKKSLSYGAQISGTEVSH